MPAGRSRSASAWRPSLAENPRRKASCSAAASSAGSRANFCRRKRAGGSARRWRQAGWRGGQAPSAARQAAAAASMVAICIAAAPRLREGWLSRAHGSLSRWLPTLPPFFFLSGDGGAAMMNGLRITANPSREVGKCAFLATHLQGACNKPQHRCSPANCGKVESPPGDSDCMDRPTRLISPPRKPAVREQYSGIFARPSVSPNS